MSKFFTYEERLELQKFLKESLSFKEISRRLSKDPTTISREVRKYSFEVARLNAIISPLAQKGQSIHQIYATHEDELMCSEKTIYNYIDACLFDVRNGNAFLQSIS